MGLWTLIVPYLGRRVTSIKFTAELEARGPGGPRDSGSAANADKLDRVPDPAAQRRSLLPATVVPGSRSHGLICMSDSVRNLKIKIFSKFDRDSDLLIRPVGQDYSWQV